MKVVQPQAFLIAETLIDDTGLTEYLEFLDVPDWDSHAMSDAEVLSEVAGKSCYLSFSTDLNKNLTRVGTRSNLDYLQNGIIAHKHGSVIEHASMTFALVNVSRLLTHELIRHRAGTAYSQESGRYVRKDECGMYIPDCIKESLEAMKLFCEAALMAEHYHLQLSRLFDLDNMQDFEKKKQLTSALRRILPEGRANVIIFTCNHRTLRHILQMRTSRHAEEEIRRAFGEVFSLVMNRFPALYADAQMELVNDLPEITFTHEKV